MWQAEADLELTLSASPATAVGQILLVYGSKLSCLEVGMQKCLFVAEAGAERN